MPRGSGRRPTPTAVKKLHGNRGKRPLNEAEPIAPAGDPEMPADLPKAAALEWKRILPELRALGVLSKIDRAALAAYCHAYARWFEAERQVRRIGVVVREPVLHQGIPLKGIARIKKNPAVTVSEGAMKLMKSFLIEFGMTPAARSRLATKPDGGKQKTVDPAEKYFAGERDGSGQPIQ